MLFYIGAEEQEKKKIGEELDVKSNEKHEMENTSQDMHILNKQVSEEYFIPQRKQICTVCNFLCKREGVLCAYFIFTQADYSLDPC